MQDTRNYATRKCCAHWFSWFAWPTAVPREGRNPALSSTFSWPSFQRSCPESPRRKKWAAGSLLLKGGLRTSELEVRSLMSGGRRPPYPLARRQRVFQFAHRAPEYWMPHFERNFGERFEHETALVHGGMRDGEPLGFDDRVPEQEYVDVEGARALFLHALASHFFFNLENPCPQLSGHLFRLEVGIAIQEPTL